MKTKTITLLTLITLSAFSYAQTGNVGINTTGPTKNLDINGDLRVRTLPIMPGGTPLVSDANGNVGIFRPVDPTNNDFTLYHVDSNVRQNDSRTVPLSSILNVSQMTAGQVLDTECWLVPNSEVRFKFPTGGSIRRGTASWGMWFEMKYPATTNPPSNAFPLIPSGGSAGTIRGPIYFHSRAYARLSKNTGTAASPIWTVMNVVSVVMQTSQMSPYFDEAIKYNETGGPIGGGSNYNFRYFLSANYSMDSATPDSEYKVELLYGIEHLSSRTANVPPNAPADYLQNWGIQSASFSYYKN
ncbi:hypothetical protein [Chryseobacterium aurantiacum]|uniref:hypothetical protein n=1 Tax=Chryseobacterium aurantiacum TaxID=2116499 RepID=UPI000D13B399|nr:hypothetical protein [Chryseobacterium aurantiacum]